MADPEFPNRPDHPDFWRLAAIVSKNDDLADGVLAQDAAGFDRIAAQITSAPLSVITYVAMQRALRVITNRRGTYGSGRGGDGLQAAFTAMWIDGFMAGTAFQKGESDAEE